MMREIRSTHSDRHIRLAIQKGFHSCTFWTKAFIEDRGSGLKHSLTQFGRVRTSLLLADACIGERA